MRKRRASTGWRKGACLILLAALLVLQASAAGTAGAGARRVLRVGFPQQAGFSQTDGKGGYSGYTYDYLREIAQYTGWDYEFVTLEGEINDVLSRMLDMLRQGELDLLGAMNYSSSLNEVFDYPGLSYGISNLALAVRRENTAVTESNFQMLDVLRIAVPARSVKNVEQLERFCESNRVSYELLRYGSEEEMLRALEQGEADAMLWNDVSVSDELRVIAKFYPSSFFFATTKGNTDLVNKLNTAIMKINESDPYFSTALHEKYFGGAGAELQLSDEETAFVKQQDPLRVAFIPDKAPIQYAGEETGEFCGLSRELFDHIARQTGLRFTFVSYAEQEALIAALGAGEVDLLAGIPYDYETAELYHVSLSRSYLSAQMVMAVGSQADPGQLAGKRLALPMGVSDKGAETDRIVRYNSVEDCIRAVNRGEADYAYGNGYTMQYYANLLRYQGVTLIPMSGQAQNLSIGVAKPVDVTLLTILNKAILSLSEGELQGMLYRSAAYVPPITLGSFLESNPAAVISGVVFLSLLVIGALLWNLHTRAAYSRQLARENARYETLCALSNEYLFEYDYTADRMTLSDQCARMFQTERVQEGFRRRLEEDGEDRGLERELLDAARRGTVGYGHELSIKMPDGAMRRFRITMKITRDGEGRPLYNVGKLADIQEEWELRNRLEERAQRDSLTGLYNAAASRQKTAGRLEQETGGALLLLDIDHFKHINDVHGHYTGDQVLAAVAGILTGSFRSADVVGRPGGDEFLVYMSGVTERGVVEEKCRNILEGCAQLRGKAAGMAVNVSIGVAMAGDCREYDVLYRRADRALYEVKGRGRNGFCFAEDMPAGAEPEAPEEA